MKQGAKKTPAARKRKRRKKPDARTRIHAVMVAAVIISAALAGALALAYFHSAGTQNEGPPPGAQTPVATAPLEKTPAPAAQAPPERIAPAAPPAPVKTTPPASAPAAQSPPIEQAPERKPEPERSPQENRTAPVSRPAPAALPPAGIIEHPAYKGTLAFVLDDAGNNLRDLEPFLKFPAPLTIAVLPGLPNSAEAGRRIRAAGKEVFLHQPMESLGGRDPGPGAIKAGMGRDEIRATVNRNLDELWPVAGINNHEGSRVTMDDEAMETLLALCRERGIVFLDSRTTADTAAPRAARRLGIVIGERDIFVDNVQERESMLCYINNGLVKAEQQGAAIMIGHVTTASLAPLLAELFPKLDEQGYSFSTASKLIRGANR